MNLEQGNANQIVDVFGFLRRRGKFVAILSGAIILLTFWVTMALPNLSSLPRFNPGRAGPA